MTEDSDRISDLELRVTLLEELLKEQGKLNIDYFTIRLDKSNPERYERALEIVMKSGTVHHLRDDKLQVPWRAIDLLEKESIDFERFYKSKYKTQIDLKEIGGVIGSRELMRYDPNEFQVILLQGEKFRQVQEYLRDNNAPFLYVGTAGAVLVSNNVASELIQKFDGRKSMVHNRTYNLSWSP